MPAFAFDKILKIVQIICSILQAAIAAFTGDNLESESE